MDGTPNQNPELAFCTGSAMRACALALDQHMAD